MHTDAMTGISLDQAVAQLQAAFDLHAAGRTEAAADELLRLLNVAPPHLGLLADTGVHCLRNGLLEPGQAWLKRCISLAPTDAQLRAMRGVALNRLGRTDEAMAELNRAIELRPGYAEAFFDRGGIWQSLEDLGRALADFEQAIALVPGYAEAHSNRGAVLQHLGREGEALASCERAVQLRPEYAQGHFNRAVVLEHLGRHEEALAGYERAIALDAGYVGAHWNRANARLLLGDFGGWQEYEWRWRGPQSGAALQVGRPLWLGETPIEGRTVLVLYEQGLGDFIQFCRLGEPLRARGARVIFEVPEALRTLASSLAGVELVGQGQRPEHFDLVCPLMSLPLALGLTRESIPARVPYLQPGAQALQRWGALLGARTKPRVGLVWSGSSGHKNDHNRSIALRTLAPLLEEPLEFHALQPEVRESDREVLQSSAMGYHGERIQSWEDTAALAQHMDLVIAVDTAGAHLAGAMGLPLWVLLPYKPDFRWLLERADSPWYPSARLWRQPKPHDWNSVVSSVRKELRTLAHGGLK